MALAFTVIAGAHSQTAEVRVKLKETDVPIAVLESFKKDFNGNVSRGWEIVPIDIIREEYVVTSFGDLNGEKPTEFAVKIKGPQVWGEAIYDADGLLKFSKTVIKDTALPPAVTKAVMKGFPGYSILKDQETIKQGKSDIIHYRVIVKKGKEKRAVSIDQSGKILHERKLSV